MAHLTRRLMEALVERYEGVDDLVSPEELAEQLNLEPEVAREQLERLERYELARSDSQGGGYRPTVTTREFLDLDLEPDETFLLDVHEHDE